MSLTIAPSLRRDVEELILAEVAKTADGDNPWRHYEHFKTKLSAVCGWDAPDGKRDQLQYDRAIGDYLTLVGL